MILVKNFYDKKTLIKINKDGCFLVSSENLNCPTQGIGGFLDSKDLVCIFVYKKKLYFQYNESIYSLYNEKINILNEQISQGTRRFQFILSDAVICDITYSEYVSSSYSAQSADKLDFLLYISQLLKDERSINEFIDNTELINNYYQG